MKFLFSKKVRIIWKPFPQRSVMASFAVSSVSSPRRFQRTDGREIFGRQAIYFYYYHLIGIHYSIVVN